MRLGSPLLLDGAADDLRVTRDADRHTIFVAGGVGIAPFRSALRQALVDGDLDATLFYSNRRPEDAAYLDELRAMEPHVRGLRAPEFRRARSASSSMPDTDARHPRRQSPYAQNVMTVCADDASPIRARPGRNDSVIRNEKPTTFAPSTSTSRRVASAVPPVASTSSTINTRAP